MASANIAVEFKAVKDSNEKTDFETGSRRDTQTGKGRPDLIPPFIVRRDSRHYENGAIKYAARNWELGQPSSQYYASAQRHLWAYIEGDRSEDHLAAIRWNVGGLMYNEEMVKRGIFTASMIDLPDYTDLESWTRTVKQPALDENQRRKTEKLSINPKSVKSVAEVLAENE